MPRQKFLLRITSSCWRLSGAKPNCPDLISHPKIGDEADDLAGATISIQHLILRFVAHTMGFIISQLDDGGSVTLRDTDSKLLRSGSTSFDASTGTSGYFVRAIVMVWATRFYAKRKFGSRAFSAWDWLRNLSERLLRLLSSIRLCSFVSSAFFPARCFSRSPNLAHLQSASAWMILEGV